MGETSNVAGATRMQKRGVALVATVCVLLAHLISLRHETTVAHVRDSAGVLEHAHALAEYHANSTTQHLHGNGARDHADVGACTLLVGLEQSTILASAPAVISAISPHVVDVALVPPTIAPAASVLTFAPKTSPPSIA